MFIFSNRNLAVRRADGSLYRIPRHFTGDIPKDVYDSLLVQKNIKAGHVIDVKTHGEKDPQEVGDAYVDIRKSDAAVFCGSKSRSRQYCPTGRKRRLHGRNVF